MQQLTSLRLFHIVISKLDELFEHDTPSAVTEETNSISPDDYKECNYLLRTASNMITSLSNNGWIVLLTHTLNQSDKHDKARSEGTWISMPIVTDD